MSLKLNLALILGVAFFAGCNGKSDNDKPSPAVGAAGNRGEDGGAGSGGQDDGSASLAGQGEGGAASAICGVHDSGRGRTSLVTLGPRNGANEVYAGPAIVERSTGSELILDFPVSSDPTDSAELRRLNWQSVAGMIKLPVGAKVWLEKNPAGPTQHVVYRPYPGFAIAIKTAENGPLILGAAYNSSLASLPSFSAVDDDTCVERHDSCRDSYDKSETYQSVKVEADEPVVIGDSQTTTIQLGGLPYEAYVTSQLVESGDCVSDYFPADGISIELRSPDMDFESLERGDLPSCSQGSDESGEISYFTSGSAPYPYEGKVVLRSVVETADHSRGLTFEYVDLVGATDETSFVLRVAADTVPTPELGTELWLSYTDHGLMALRESETGPLMAVAGTVGALSDPASSTALQEWLGSAVTAEKGCVYANGSTLGEAAEITLSELSIATAKPVRATTGKRTPLELDGVPYNVWVGTDTWRAYSTSSASASSFAIFPH